MLVQPFEFCVHLDRNQTKPHFDVDSYRSLTGDLERRHKKLWRSFASNYVAVKPFAANNNYDIHGHVGFAWGARREVLYACPLYDKALIGGSNHILAHAAVGQIPSECIAKSFTDDLNDVKAWMNRFYNVVNGQLGYVPGDLYHIWHGDIASRRYLKRIRDFTKEAKDLNERDRQGFRVAKGSNRYMRRYYREREVAPIYEDEDWGDFYIDDDFVADLGYSIFDFIQNISQPTGEYDDPGAGAVSDTPPDPPHGPLRLGRRRSGGPHAGQPGGYSLRPGRRRQGGPQPDQPRRLAAERPGPTERRWGWAGSE
jgi:hypothetical protein